MPTKEEKIKVSAKGRDVSDITEEEIKKVVIGSYKYNLRSVMIGKKFGDEIKYCAFMEYKEMKVPELDEDGHQKYDIEGNPIERVDAKMYFLPIGFPVSYECNTVIHKDDFIPLKYTGNNNTPDFHRGIEDLKKRYILSVDHLGK